jgi:predicted secreted protein
LIAACGQQSEKDQTKKRVKGVAPTAPSKPLFVPILAGVTIAAILTIGIYYWMQNDTGSASGYRIPNSVPVVLLSNELLPAPSIDRLPPGTKDAGFQYPEFPHRVVGPRRPKAGLQILRTQPGANDIKLLLEGADGTLYVATERERLWAIRDRKVIWGFEVNTYQFSASSLGLMKPYDAVFNAAGQGGHLRNTPWYEALPSPLPHGLESRLIGRQEYCKSAYPLDHDCENGTGDGAGNVYLLTATKNLYAFDQNRKQLWVTPVPCRAPELMEFAGDTLVLGCRAARDGLAESLVGVREGKVAWTFKADTDISFSNSPASGSFLVDGTGAMYFVDTADPIHLYGLNRDGREMWRYNLGRTRVEGMWLDSRGRLFLSHDFWRNGASGAALTCLADKGC